MPGLRQTGPSLREQRNKVMSFSAGENPFNHPQLSLTVSNLEANAARKTFAILPGINRVSTAEFDPLTALKDANGDNVQFVCKTGTALAGTLANVTVAMTPIKIEQVIQHLASGTKFRLYGMKILVNNQQQLSEEMTFRSSKLVNTEQTETTSIIPSSAKSSSENNTLLADIDMTAYNLMLKSDTELCWAIQAGCQAKITFFVEALRV